jgi:hypothetical protein
MAATFTRRANLFMHLGLAVVAIAALCFTLLVWGVPLMNYNTQVGFAPTQPVPFSHKTAAIVTTRSSTQAMPACRRPRLA